MWDKLFYDVHKDVETTLEEWNDGNAIIMCLMSYLNDLWVSKEEKIQSNKSKGYENLLKIMWLLHIYKLL